MEFVKELEKIKNNQTTIDILLAQKKIIPSHEKTPQEGKWYVNAFYNKKDTTIGFAICESAEGFFPDHIHEGAIEYLICVQGSFIETFGQNGVDGFRIVKEGECVSIPKGILHSSKPLTTPVKMVYVCVPQDERILLSEKDIP